MGKMHSRWDPITQIYGKNAQQDGLHSIESWGKGTAGGIPLNTIMGEMHSEPDPIKQNYGKNAQRAGSH